MKRLLVFAVMLILIPALAAAEFSFRLTGYGNPMDPLNGYNSMTYSDSHIRGSWHNTPNYATARFGGSGYNSFSSGLTLSRQATITGSDGVYSHSYDNSPWKVDYAGASCVGCSSPYSGYISRNYNGYSGGAYYGGVPSAPPIYNSGYTKSAWYNGYGSPAGYNTYSGNRQYPTAHNYYPYNTRGHGQTFRTYY